MRTIVTTLNNTYTNNKEDETWTTTHMNKPHRQQKTNTKHKIPTRKETQHT